MKIIWAGTMSFNEIAPGNTSNRNRKNIWARMMSFNEIAPGNEILARQGMKYSLESNEIMARQVMKYRPGRE